MIGVSEGLKEFQDLARKLLSQGYSQKELSTRINNSVPVSIFSGSLSPLQALVTYLKNVQQQDYHTIAEILNRHYKTVWTSHCKEGISYTDTTTYLPLHIFSGPLSVFEAIVWYLHLDMKLKFSEIARLLHKDDRTVWTVWNRAKKKQKKEHEENSTANVGR